MMALGTRNEVLAFTGDLHDPVDGDEYPYRRDCAWLQKLSAVAGVEGTR
jgi:hypothetical protein